MIKESDGRQSAPPAAMPASNDLAELYGLTDRLFRSSSLADVYDAALDAIESTLGCRRASILLFDDSGVMRFVAWRGLSAGYRKAVDGHSPWRAGDRAPDPILVEDIAATNEPEPLKRAIRQEGISALAFVPLVVRGGVVGKFMTYYEAPHVFSQREIDLAVTIARQVGFSIERAQAEEERRAAQRALQEQEERSRVMLERAPVMIWTSKPTGSCEHLNLMMREFWGLQESEVSSFDWAETIHPDDAPRIAEIMTRAVSERSGVRLQGRYRNVHGVYRVLLTDAQPRYSSAGEFLGMIGVNVDVTEREEAEAQRELLLAELNHRVKNTLAVVQALAQQTFKGSEVPAHLRTAFQGRLHALAVAHTMLTQSNWTNASLSRLAEDTLNASLNHGERLSLEGPRILLDPKAALAVTMALHEMLTNAVKYGAYSNECGTIAVRWELIDAPKPRFRLEWKETGGPPVVPPTKAGFGSRLIQRLIADDLCGKVNIDFQTAGVVCLMEGQVSANHSDAA